MWWYALYQIMHQLLHDITPWLDVMWPWNVEAWKCATSTCFCSWLQQRGMKPPRVRVYTAVCHLYVGLQSLHVPYCKISCPSLCMHVHKAEPTNLSINYNSYIFCRPSTMTVMEDSFYNRKLSSYPRREKFALKRNSFRRLHVLWYRQSIEVIGKLLWYFHPERSCPDILHYRHSFA